MCLPQGFGIVSAFYSSTKILDSHAVVFPCALGGRVAIVTVLVYCLLSSLIVNSTLLPSQKWTGLGDISYSHLFTVAWSVRKGPLLKPGFQHWGDSPQLSRCLFCPLLCGCRGSSDSCSDCDFPSLARLLLMPPSLGVLRHSLPYCLHSHHLFHMCIDRRLNGRR